TNTTQTFTFYHIFKCRFLSVTVGDNIALRCDSIGGIGVGAKLYWYKQSLGRKPELVSSFLRYDKKREFHGEFIRSNRVKLDNDNGKNDLYISDSIVSDSAVYHCVCCYLHQTDFFESYTVIVKSLNIQTKVYQSPYEETEEGRSVTLNCSVHTGSCGGKPRVYWFKQSEEFTPGVLYSHGGGDDDQCEETTDRPTNSCVYSLPIHNMSSEQTGTYYCAVAACGQVLFGNGTTVKIKGEFNFFCLSIDCILLWSTIQNVSYTLLCPLEYGSNSSDSVLYRRFQENVYSKDQGLIYISDYTDIIIHILNVLYIFCLFLGQGFPKLLQYMATEQVTKSEGRGQMDDTWTECVYFSVEQGN
uniref:Ig-like domain-containing protein n=1 Tax=Neogobius melanostomus TaxID=47308 RepID=A0A8C6SU03_9GOBI